MTTVGDLGEFGLIARLTAALPPHGGVVLGVGDDAALLDVGNATRLLVATCDAQVEGTHFRLTSATPEEIGRRVLAVNLSDIAAMGGIPQFALISLLVPLDMDVAVLDGIYAGLRAEATQFGVAIVGGNVARSERLVLDITLLGSVARAGALRRDGAHAGDALLVTGTLGAAAAGLRLLEDPTLAARLAAWDCQPLLAAQRTPVPRVAAGQWLARHGATAALDVSDGLAADLAHLCAASGVGAVVQAAALPISVATKAVAMELGVVPEDLALFGGEDYELLFTVPAEIADELAENMLAEIEIPVTVIGHIQAEGGLELARMGQKVPLAPKGWDHLRATHTTE
ncbi:MAG: thiamine-phosphate kinase [Ktedonobacterales bacterium]|nr:thiamine-phosphate kinase [Ktedonobacterales bacterium]